MKKSQIVEIILHVVFWTIWPIMVLMQDQNIMIGVFRSSDTNFYIAAVYGTLFNISIFYITTFKILPYFFNQKKYLFGVIASIAYFSLICFFEGLTDYIVLSHFYFPANSLEIAERLNDQVFIAAFVLNMPFLLIVYVYRVSKDWYRNEKIKQELKEERLISELQFLKSQINPHFLFNTLNNLFGMARQIDAIPVADGIAKLSNLMRYMLYDSEVDKVSVEKEISHIQDYIELQKLRILSSENIDIKININSSFKNLKIAPLLLIPFVENAFKHGISLKEKSEIIIDLNTDDSSINFNITNTINKLRKDREEENSGFGLKNVQKRLDIIYSNKYKLDIKKDNYIYSVSLKIDTTS